MKVKIKRTSPSAILPTQGSSQAAGLDLYADINATNYYSSSESSELTIPSNSTYLIPCGFSIEIPEGYFGGIYARSGLATKQGLRPANCVGVVDSDYRGVVRVAIHNDSNAPQSVKHGDRIAQLIIQPYLPIELEEVDNLTETDRGEGGFGSTGK